MCLLKASLSQKRNLVSLTALDYYFFNRTNIIYIQYIKWLAVSVEKNGVIIVEILNIQENLYQMSTILFIHFKFSVNFVLLSNVCVACFKVAQ